MFLSKQHNVNHHQHTYLNFISRKVLFFELLALQSLKQTSFADISVTLDHNFHCNKQNETYAETKAILSLGTYFGQQIHTHVSFTKQ